MVWATEVKYLERKYKWEIVRLASFVLKKGSNRSGLR
jgi:hypothetical protein